MKTLVLLIFMSVGSVGICCQQTSADFSFLLKLRTNELNTWIKSKRKEDLIIIVNYLLKDYENQKETAISDENVRIALTIAKSSKDFLTLGKIHYIRGLGFIEKDSNKTNEALDAFALAQENLINNNSQDSKILLGKTLLEIANIQINTVNGDKDREVLSNILSTYSLLKAINSQHLMGLTYKTLGLYFFYQSKYTYALSCFEKAEKYLQEIKDYNSLLEINTFSIHLFRNIFVRTKLAERKQKIEEILKFSTSKRKKMLALFAIGESSNANGDATEAIKYYRLAKKIAIDINDARKTLSYQYSIGKTYQWEGDAKNAEIELRQLLKIANNLLIKDDELIRRSKIGLAAALESQNRSQESQEIFTDIENDLGTSTITKFNFYSTYAQFLYSKDNLKLSKTFLELAKKELNPKYIDTISHLTSQILLLDYKIKTISEDETIKKLDESILQIKDEQLSTKSVGINLNYLEEFIFPFKFKTLVQIEKGDFEAALLHSDSYKSRWLMSRMALGKSFGVVNKDWIFSDEAKELRDKIFQRLLISGLRSEDEADVDLQYLLKTHEKKLNQHQDLVNLAKNIEKSELSTIELNGLLSTLSGTAILSYSFTNEFLSVFVLRQNNPVKVFKINVNEKDLRAKIEKWRTQIVERDLGFKKESRELYDLLIKPFEAEISDASNLIVIPDENLWKIPFQALLDSQQKYLIQKFPITYVPSLKVLQTIQAKKSIVSTNSKYVVAFGNPINNSFRKLPESENEVKNISQIYPSSSNFIREKATETTLKVEMEKANVLHLAVHGKLNETEPMRSAIILTKDAQNDGFFGIEEIISLNKSPELVILSACSTNNGQVFKGEGLLSLTWAFLVAGSKNVIGTHWEIDDKATNEEMQLFHQMYSKNNSISKSLQFAVLKQIEKKGIQNHPFYWAGFVSVGGF